jgi:hypothetical protein
MKNQPNPVEGLLQRLLIQNRAFDHAKSITPWTKACEVSRRKVVEHRDSRSLTNQSLDEVRTNEPRTASHAT